MPSAGMCAASMPKREMSRNGPAMAIISAQQAGRTAAANKKPLRRSYDLLDVVVSTPGTCSSSSWRACCSSMSDGSLNAALRSGSPGVSDRLFPRKHPLLHAYTSHQQDDHEDDHVHERHSTEAFSKPRPRVHEYRFQVDRTRGRPPVVVDVVRHAGVARREYSIRKECLVGVRLVGMRRYVHSITMNSPAASCCMRNGSGDQRLGLPRAHLWVRLARP